MSFELFSLDYGGHNGSSNCAGLMKSGMEDMQGGQRISKIYSVKVEGKLCDCY